MKAQELLDRIPRALALGLLLSAGAVHAQGGRALSLQLDVAPDSIGPIEPLEFRLTIMNHGTEALEGLATWAVRSTTSVEFLAPGATDWQRLEVPFLNRYQMKFPLGGLPPLALPAGAESSAGLSVSTDPDRSYRTGRIYYYFAQPGEYRLRAAYKPAAGDLIRSAEKSFRVVPYQGTDRDASGWLLDRPIPHFMYDFEVYADNSAHHTDDDARELLARFPQSIFAPWAKLFLARCYAFGLRQGKAKTDRPDLSQAERLVLELADAVDPRVRRDAAGLLEEIQKRR
ncbi:MAG: hypothetical protein HY650_04515 [Acidobacteria bacterium]|nr:hypothetical protein [Acidobacteriota bacterium]